RSTDLVVITRGNLLMQSSNVVALFFLSDEPTTTEIYTLSLHDALPIYKRKSKHSAMLRNKETRHRMFIGLLNTTRKHSVPRFFRSEERFSRNAETDLVCRLLLEKKKKEQETQSQN